MQVLVDTSLWSLALHKQNIDSNARLYIEELTELITDARVVMIGAIRQEILSGIKSSLQFAKLKLYFKAFPDLLIETADYEFAAELFNHCRNAGVQGSHIDFLITAVAINRKIAVYTLDQDFDHYAKHTALVLHKLSKS